MARGTLDTAQVIDAAATMADAHGLDATTLSALAREIGVKPPSLYKHVDSRGALLGLLATRALRDLIAVIAAATTGRSGAAAVHAAAAAYRDYAHTRPGLYAATAPFQPAGDEDYRAAALELVATLEAVLRAWDLDQDARIDAIRGLRAALHGFVTLEAAGGFAMARSVDASFARLVDALIAGLGVPAEPRP